MESKDIIFRGQGNSIYVLTMGKSFLFNMYVLSYKEKLRRVHERLTKD